MNHFRNKLRHFMLRSARDVATQALPNWAQIPASLAQNFYDIFVACPQEEQDALLLEAEQVSSNEWQSIRRQVAEELGEQYAEALDQARTAMRGVQQQRGRTTQRSEVLRQALNQSMRLGNLQVQRRRRIARGVAVSVLLAASSEAPPRSSWPQVPGFDLTGWLGEGAQAKVFVAKRQSAGELAVPVALKVGVLSDRVRFEREVDVMRQVQSPHLLSVLGHGIVEGFVPLFWIEMPLMGGHSLADVGETSLEEGVRLCLGVLEGLKALHEYRVAHRDLKPSNVLLSASGAVRLADFGLSKRVGDAGASVTTTGMVMGSPAYMSPEAINGQKVGLSGDVWSLGVLLCEVLAGHLPFPGEVAGQVWAAVLRDTPVLDGVPEWLMDGVKACLQKDVGQRPQDAGALERLIERPMKQYLEEQRSIRVRERERLERIEVLRAELKSDSELRDVAILELSRVIEGLNAVETARRIESLAAQFVERLSELKGAQTDREAELARLENHNQRSNVARVGRNRSNSNLRLERGIVEVSSGGFMGFGKTKRQVHVELEVYDVDGIEFKMVRIPGKSYAIAQTQVTQALYRAVTGKSPSNFTGDQLPVEQVSWEDGIVFCNELSKKLGLKPAYRGMDNRCELIEGANGFRLPFEAEWEFAAKGGENYEYAGSDNIDEVAWYDDNSGGETHPVGQKKANGYGLYDCSGNVWEWCADDHNNPGKHMPGASLRALRGGGWFNVAYHCQVSNRYRNSPDVRSSYLGLRLSRSLE